MNTLYCITFHKDAVTVPEYLQMNLEDQTLVSNLIKKSKKKRDKESCQAADVAIIPDSQEPVNE